MRPSKAAALGPIAVKHAESWRIPLPALERRLAMLLLRQCGDLPVRVQVGEAEQVAVVARPLATVRIRDLTTLLKLIVSPDLGFGESYFDGSLKIEGDLVAVLEAYARARLTRVQSTVADRFGALLEKTRANTLAGSRRNIHHHYDLGNDFYRLWLDESMVYTCAYFEHPDATLEAAQTAKLDHVCRKLELKSGERVVDAGCGWGGFALRAAMKYGAKVRAFSLSHEQIVYARERARALGVSAQCEFIEDDYRNIDGQYDAFVSIGMLEHVGREHFDDLGSVIGRCLAANGRGLIHSIGQNRPLPLNSWIGKRIFPGAYPPTLREMVSLLEPLRCTVLDVENLRPHYARTIEHWLQRFELNRERIAQMYDEAFVRAWRLYLTGSIAAFRAGTLQLFQVLFARDAATPRPWTRAHWYERAD